MNTEKKPPFFAHRFISKITEEVLGRIDKLSEQQLKSVIKAANSYSNTNCWWANLEMQSAVLVFATDKLTVIKQQKKQARLDAKRLAKLQANASTQRK